eukprot:COSAG01_NODE_81_length_27820_cov_22.659753_8_plen_958_part_00
MSDASYARHDDESVSDYISRLQTIKLERQKRLDALHRKVWVSGHREKKKKTYHAGALASHGSAAGPMEQESSNTMGWLMDLEHKCARKVIEQSTLQDDFQQLAHLQNQGVLSSDEARLAKQHLADAEQISWVWSMVFNMPKHTSKADEGGGGGGGEGGGDDGGGDGDAADLPPSTSDDAASANPRDVRISHEAWSVADKCEACDLHIKHELSADKSRLILIIGAPYDVLIDEAGQRRLLMRMQETKGHIDFHIDLIPFFASNHGGLNECAIDWDHGGVFMEPTQWNARPMQREKEWRTNVSDDESDDHDDDDDDDDDDDNDDDDDDDDGDGGGGGGGDDGDGDGGKSTSGTSLAGTKPEAEFHAKDTHKYMRRMNRKIAGKRIFTSALMQRLVMQRMKRIGHIDPEVQKSCPKPEQTLKWMIQHTVEKRKRVTAQRVHQLLLSHGAYRPQNHEIFRKVEGVDVVPELCSNVLRDPQFVLEPKGTIRSNSLTEKDGLTFRRLIDVCHVLEQWRNQEVGPGRNESFVRTLHSCFPLHCESELDYLRRDWARFGLLWVASITGFNPEGQPQELGADERRELGLSPADPPDYTKTTFGSDANFAVVHTWPLSLVYQPLEEIRDYFGDDVGLYFSWLGHYSKALVVMATFGTIVMVAQPLIAVDGKSGPDQNPLTLVYSVYVGLWSIVFLEQWRRRESELRFLWGSEGLSEIDEPRREFQGVLEVNPDTGRQRFVVKSSFEQFQKRIAATFVVMIMILITASAATIAYLIRYYDSDEASETEDMGTDNDGSETGLSFEMMSALLLNKKWEVFSAALNLFIIVIFGVIFEGIAVKLNNHENHRTEAEYANALIMKNFLFQFVNNYFVLFYIAFFSEIPDPFSKEAHPCEGGSCLDELQMQLIVVFSLKTIGKQVGYTLRPFLFKALNVIKLNRGYKKIMSNAEGLMQVIEDAYAPPPIYLHYR